VVGPIISARLIRKQTRLATKLARVRAKLANLDGATAYRVSEYHNGLVSMLRRIASVVLWAAFWWLGCKAITGILDDIFGPEERLIPVAPQTISASGDASTSGHTFWTFGRRMRSGESQIVQR
jgi:hypothetical protein